MLSLQREVGPMKILAAPKKKLCLVLMRPEMPKTAGMLHLW